MPPKNRNAILALGSSVAIVVMTLYGFSAFFYSPLHKEILALQSSVQDLQRQLNAMRGRAQQLSKMQEEMASLQVDVADLEKQLPKDRELPSLIRILTHRAETYGLTLSILTPGKALPKGLYDEIPYSVNLSTSFNNLGHFLTAMGKGDRLFAARNLALTPASAKTDPSRTINATFTLIAFRYHG